MKFALLWKIGTLVLSALLGLLTAGNGAAVAFNGVMAGDYSGGYTAVGTGIGSLLFGALAFLPSLLGKFLPDANANNVPKELADVLAAVQTFVANPADRSALRNLLVQLLEAVIAIAQAVVQDPELDAALATALALVQKHLSPVAWSAKVAARAPVPGGVVVIDAPPTRPTVAQAIALAEAQQR